MPGGLSELLESLMDKAADEDITIGEMVDQFEERGLGAVMFLLAFIVFLPTGFIPGLATLAYGCLILVALQIVLGRHCLWLPGRIRHISLSELFVRRSIERSKPTLRWLDRHTHQRHARLVSTVAIRCVAFVCLCIAIISAPLSLLPGAGSVIAIPIMFFGLGMMMHDGLVIGLGLVSTVLLIVGGIYWALVG